MKKFRTIKKCVSIVYKASPGYFISKIIISLMQAIRSPLMTVLYAQLILMITEPSGNAKKMVYAVLLVLFHQFTQYLCTNISFLASVKTTMFGGAKVKNRMEEKIRDKMVRLQAVLLEDADVHSNMELAVEQSGTVMSIFEGIFNIASIAVNLILSFVVVVRISWFMPLLILLFTVPNFYMNKRYEELRQKIRREVLPLKKHRRHIINLLTDKYAREEIKIFSLDDFLSEKYRRDMAEILTEEKKILKKELKNEGMIGLCAALGNTICVAVPTVNLIRKAGTVADIAVVINISDNIKGSISSLSESYNNVQKLLHDADAVFGFIENADVDEAISEAQSVISSEIEEIRFDDVSFSYGKDSGEVIKNISLTIKKGEYIAVSGLNGAGKTTFVKLLCGLYKPGKGTIYYNGIPHTEIAQRDIYSHFAMLSQNFSKYALSLRQNITLTEYPDEKRFHDVINLINGNIIAEEKASGWDTMCMPELNSGGTNLSGGQWQKIAAGRTFYQNADILIFDEPSAAVDPVEETRLYKAIQDYGGVQTKILISHRLSYMKDVDRILFFDGGRLAGEGRIKDLLRDNNDFAKMYKVQSNRYLELMQEAD